MDARTVELHVTTLTKRLKGLADDPEFAELLAIIHRPGWTTPAEAALVVGMLETMNAHVQHLTQMKQALLEGARAVVAKAQPVDQEKVKEALKAAGAVIPDTPDLQKQIKEALKKGGVTPELTILANGNYALVVPD
jgi:hypothetical protein